MGQDYDAVVTESQQLILRGPSQAVDLLRKVPEPARDHTFRLVLGDAYRTKGDFSSAMAAYREVGDRGVDGPIEAAVAWRLGQIHQQQGEPRRALEIYSRADMTEADAVDHAWLLAGVATAHWLLGDADQALAYARAASARATIASDPRALAAAHIAMALSVSLGGDPATVDEEYVRAAAYATEAGDQVQLARIDANRSHHLLADARFAEAVQAAAAAGATAGKIGSSTLLAVALVNEAEGLLRLGRSDEAVDRCERALALAGQIGTRRTASALVGLAQIHLRRGWREQARAALEQALRLQGAEPDRQVRVPALACLAITLLPEDVEFAAELAEQALREATGSARLPALLAAGRTAWARGDVGAARFGSVVGGVIISRRISGAGDNGRNANTLIPAAMSVTNDKADIHASRSRLRGKVVRTISPSTYGPFCTSSISMRAIDASPMRPFGSFVRQRRSNRRIAGERPKEGRPRGIALEHRRQRVADILALERALAGEHLVEHAPERPDVAALVHRLAPRLLRAHVSGGAEQHADAGHHRG